MQNNNRLAASVQPETGSADTAEDLLSLAFAHEAAQFHRLVTGGEVPDDFPVELENVGICDYCGEPGDDIEDVESRDDETGYSEVTAMCGGCRYEIRHPQADVDDARPHPDLLLLLGVDESWLYQEGGAIPRKPVKKDVGCQISDVGEEKAS